MLTLSTGDGELELPVALTPSAGVGELELPPSAGVGELELPPSAGVSDGVGELERPVVLVPSLNTNVASALLSGEWYLKLED